MGEHTLFIFVGVLLGALQTVIIILLKVHLNKLVGVCAKVDSMQTQLGTKTGDEAHEKVLVTLGKIGDRVLELEIASRLKKI